MIHRDLKPQNIMVGSFGEVQVMDWGLAKVLAADRRAEETGELVAIVIRTLPGDSNGEESHAGSVLGTAGYMAPEQARGEVDLIDERADVFGLGAILCKILTGRAAFTGRTSGAILRKTEEADLREVMGRLDSSGAEAELLAIARSCLSAEPFDRPRHAGAVANAVKGYLEGVQERLQAAELARVEATARAKGERTRRRFTAALAATTLLATAIGAGWWATFRMEFDARVAKTDSDVGGALVVARMFLAQAERVGPDNLEAWVRALDSADRARALLAGRPSSPGLESKILALYEKVNGETVKARHRAQRREIGRDLAEVLDEAHLERDQDRIGRLSGPSLCAGYARAFRGVGVDPFLQSPDDSARKLAELGERERIAGAIDDWAIAEKAPERKAHLDAIARRIDPDPFRNRLREAPKSGDAAGLISLARLEECQSLPASSVVLFADYLRSQNARAEATALLYLASQRFPGDFRIHCDLASCYQFEGKSLEAVRNFAVAVALRPSSAGARYSLGQALSNQGEYGQAVDQFRVAIRFWDKALADDPKRGEDCASRRRYHAACSAAMAGSGPGINDRRPDEAKQKELRMKALGWLREELAAWSQALDSKNSPDRSIVLEALRTWKGDAKFSGVRDAGSLARFSEDERKAWQSLWADVDALLAGLM